jgi:outer membrane protein assembly factor BamE (lipoprotein component of BamABCDE complex)
MKRLSIFMGTISLLLMVGCAPQTITTDRLTLGTVQSSLHEGMSQADVQAALGAPNIVSKDASDREVWTYDKIYKQSESRSFFFWASSASTQKTLTVLITFDENGRVTEYKYHGTEF